MRNILFLFAVWLLLPFKTAADPAFIDDLRCMPVLIQVSHPPGTNISFGTGIYLDESNHLFFVTAAHCIYNPNSTNRTELIDSDAILTSLSRETNVTARAITVLDLQILAQSGKIKRHKTHDVAVICLGTIVPVGGGQRVDYNPGIVRSAISPVPWAAEDMCKAFDDVSIGSDSYVLGYPVNLLTAQPNGEPPQIDFSSPLVRRGIISQKNYNTRKLVIDSAVFGGNSGGPVLVADHSFGGIRFYLVGLVVEFVPAEASVELRTSTSPTAAIVVNSGYGMAEPIDYALELMRQFETDN